MKPGAVPVAHGDQPVAIVYPACVKAAYGVIRNLGERGIPVVALNPMPHSHLRSRWATPMLSPDVTTDPEGFFDFVAALAAPLPQGAVLYMMEDVYVYLAHVYRDRLPPNVRYPFLDAEALEMTLNKQAMLEAAERAGVPVPWTRYPANMDELDALRETIPFPCVMKPLVSRFSFGDRVPDIERFPKVFDGKCVRADSFMELKLLFARALANHIPVCIQEQLEGPNETIYTVHLYADARHEILGAATGRKVRQLPADFGVGTLCEACRIDEALPLAQALVRAVRHHGIAGIEFMTDPKTGQLKLIEINPRGIHWMSLAAMVGVELPYLQYADLLGRPERQTQHDYSLRWLDMRRDWQYIQRYGHHKAAPFYYPPLRWAASLIGARPSVFNFKDPMPGLHGMLSMGFGPRVRALKQLVARRP